MTLARTLLPLILVLVLPVLAACVRGGSDADPGTATRSSTVMNTGAVQTRLPGHITAGGGTSGTVMATMASAPSKDMGTASRQAGTPGIPQGAGGNTSGTEMGGTTGTSAIANTGEQTTQQRAPGQGAPAHAGDTGPAAASAGANASVPMASPASSSPPSPSPTPTPAATAASAAVAAAEQARLLDERMTLVARRWQQQGPRQGASARPTAPSASAASH